MTAAEARVHLRYSAWASLKLIDAVRNISGADFEMPVGVAHGSLRGTLSHMPGGSPEGR
jgi:uncharacterized damage-inducible protein DinB